MSFFKLKSLVLFIKIISKEQLQLYLEYGFTAVKIAQLFCVSVKTIFRRLDKWGIQRKKI